MLYSAEWFLGVYTVSTIVKLKKKNLKKKQKVPYQKIFRKKYFPKIYIYYIYDSCQNFST